ncbi:hypothetical protein V6N11_050090 [Hibiscus sabdariffa]|uniref:Uncharacterized protein n=1 Tax=Hibiscus sabdariffa TaxID=183260 RepID=A0ABR2T9P0_9ROSI
MTTIIETYEVNTRMMKKNSEMLQEILRQVKSLAAHLGTVDEGEINDAGEVMAEQDNPNSMIYQDFLYDKSYISGNKLSKDDIKVYAAILKNPGDTFPNISKWYNSVSSQLVTSFPWKAIAVGFGGKVALAEPVEDHAADDDDLDLFGMKLGRKREIP